MICKTVLKIAQKIEKQQQTQFRFLRFLNVLNPKNSFFQTNFSALVVNSQYIASSQLSHRLGRYLPRPVNAVLNLISNTTIKA